MNLKDFKDLDEDSQIELIEDLEVNENATYKFTLFKKVLKCLEISDLTRIEILNVLGVYDIPENIKKDFIEIILEYIDKKEEDYTFISHCIMALQSKELFSRSVYSKMLVIFLDPKEYDDLRFNAEVIIRNNTKGEKLIEYYNDFINKSDPAFSKHSKQWIEEVNKGITKKSF